MQRTTSLTIFSPNYPKPYPRAVECVWQLRAPEGYVIQYMVTQFTTPNQHAKRLPFGIYRPDRYTKITCSTSLSYTEGSISFYDGTYNESDNRCGSFPLGTELKIGSRTVPYRPSYGTSVRYGRGQYCTAHGTGWRSRTAVQYGFVIRVFYCKYGTYDGRAAPYCRPHYGRTVP